MGANKEGIVGAVGDVICVERVSGERFGDGRAAERIKENVSSV